MADPVYLDHAATAPILPEARAAMASALDIWANPSSPHGPGRAARAALEEARSRICAALDWDGELIFTSGASEAISLGLASSRMRVHAASAVEHAAVLRCAADAPRLAVDAQGALDAFEVRPGGLYAVQHANNETGVIQPVAALAERIRAGGSHLFCDAAQSAGKIALPREADMIAISAHKCGGPPGIGALLLRDPAMLHARGGQEKGLRQGTENLPAAMGFAAAVSASRDWLETATVLRDWLDAAIASAGGVVIADAAQRIPTIASYAMPGIASSVQIIRFDMARIAVSAGSACSSGTLKASPVLSAMGLPTALSECAIRVSIGPQTTRLQLEYFFETWCNIMASSS